MWCSSSSRAPEMQSQGTPRDNLLRACPPHVLSVMPLLFDLLCLQRRRRSKKSWTLPLISALLCLFCPFFSLFLTIGGEARHRESSSAPTAASSIPSPEHRRKVGALLPEAVGHWKTVEVVKAVSWFSFTGAISWFLSGHKDVRRYLVML